MTNRGFTLIDLLVTLSITAIILAVGVPSFFDFIEKNRTTLAVNKMVGAINFARVEAISYGQTVTLCPQLEELHCGKDWSTGVIVFIDREANGKIDEADQVIRVFESFTKGSAAKWSSFGSNNYLRFRADGSTINQNGSFTYCPSNGNEKFAHQIVVNRTGRVRLAKDSDDDGIKENTKGKNISCS